MSYQICVEAPQVPQGVERFACAADSSVLRAMESLGRKGIPVGCRGGGCGVCKVQVLEGAYRTATMSRACVSREEQAQGYALACKLIPHANLRLRVVGKMSRCFSAAGASFHFHGAPPARPSSDR